MQYRIKWLDTDYTGGNTDVVWGQFTDGNYFYGGSGNYSAYILDENPGEYHNNPEEYDGVQYGDDYNWLLEHSVVELSEREEVEFWIYLINYCQRNKIRLFTYDNPNIVLRELKSFLRR